MVLGMAANEDALLVEVPKEAVVGALRARKQQLVRNAESMPQAAEEVGRPDLARTKTARLNEQAGNVGLALEHVEELPEDRVVLVNVRTLLNLVPPADLRRYIEEDLAEVRK